MLLWLLGVEVLPNLHLAAHADDHTHAANGTIVTVSFDTITGETHRHDDGSVHADHADADHQAAATKRRVPLDTSLGVPPHPGHAATGIGHRLAALLAPPPPVTAAVAVLTVQTWTYLAPRGLAQAIEPAPPSARGPPTA